CGAARDSGACTPTQGTTASGKLCGVVGDGCGGSIDCGGCTGGQTCGGAGTANVCGAPRDSGACMNPTRCTTANGSYCGVVGDGCGGTIDCGNCAGGQVCGARTAHVCNAPCPLCAPAPQCEAGTTSISGPGVTGTQPVATADPVYNALVYIPNGTVPTITDGASCDRCTPITPDTAVASAITGPDGTFTLTNVPAGANI